jgi:starvation-inducible DNA-binding protein
MWKRPILDKERAKAVGDALQPVLVDLIDMAHVGKQAHWNLFGREFLSIHAKLDEVVASARAHADAVAERMDKIGVAPDGRTQTVAATSRLPAYPETFVEVPQAVSKVCDAIAKLVHGLREAQQKTADPDPVTEDLVIAILHDFEEHLWMLQAVEGHDPNK